LTALCRNSREAFCSSSLALGLHSSLTLSALTNSDNGNEYSLMEEVSGVHERQCRLFVKISLTGIRENVLLSHLLYTPILLLLAILYWLYFSLNTRL